jgi:hypothetical protein
LKSLTTKCVTDSGRMRIDFPEITIFILFFGNNFLELGGFFKGNILSDDFRQL